MGQHMLALAAHLRDRHSISVICPDSPEGYRLLASADALGLDTLPLTVRDGGRGWGQLHDWLRGRRIALFHGHAGVGWEGHDGIAAARAAGVPVVVRTEHLPYMLTETSQRARHRRLMAQIDQLICVSEEASAGFLAAGIPAHLVSTVRNGITPPSVGLGGQGIRAELGLPSTVGLALTVGRLTPQKGYAILAAAAPAVFAQVPDIHFIWAGVGALEGELRARVRELGVEGRIHLLGQRADVAALMAAANVFVLPSRFEGLPLVVLEAMAAGLPVVGTNVCGTAEAVVDGVTGRLVTANDPAALAAGIVDVLADSRRAAMWGRAGRRRVAREFSADRMACETASIYGRLLQARATLPGGWWGPVQSGGGGRGRVRRHSEHASSPAGSVGIKERTMEQVRICFIGAGGIANRHLGNLLAFPDVQVTALADPDWARASASASRCDARPYTDYAEMLEREQPDAVYICVPPFAHGGPEQAALARGIPFFVEKPLSVDLQVAEEIARGVAAKGLTTAVGYHWRYLDTVDEIKERLASNPARLALGYWLDGTPPPAWWGREEESGGQMVEQTTHIFDLARYLLGPVQEVQAIGARHARPDYPDLDIDDISLATLRFTSGAIGSFASTCILKWPHRIGLHLFGDGLAIELSEFDLMVDVGQGRPVREARNDPFVREDRDFVDAVLGRPDRIRVPYAEALETHRLVTAAARAAREGRTLGLDLATSTQER